METKKSGFHYAWVILIACCILYSGSMALVNSIISVYVLPVTTALGCGRGDFTFMLTCQTISLLIALPILGNLAEKENVNFNLIMTVCGCCLCACPLICSFSTQLWQFYIAGFIGGFGIAACFTFASPVLINNWFAPQHRGKMLGIAAAFTGISTIAWAPLFTGLVQTYGYQTTYLINAIVQAVLILPTCIFLIKRKPADKGLLPFGADEAGEGENSVAYMTKAGVPAAKALKTPAFWLMFLGVAITAIGGGWGTQITPIAKELLADSPDAANAAMIGAAAISAMAVGNLLSKLGFGFCVDRINVGITFVIFQVVWLFAFLLWAFGGANTGLIIAGGFCLGFCNAPSRVGWPAVVRTVFGNGDFAKIWSYTALASSIMGGLSGSVIGWIYDFTGSYMGTVYGGMVVVVVVAILGLIVSSFKGKLEWETIEQK